ncbi:hypothetical protein [Dysgonomonas sp.]
MATEWFVQAFENQEEQFILTEKILEIIPEYKIEKEYNYIEVKLSNDIVSIFIDLNSERNSGFMISRPVKSLELYSIIYKIMKLGNFILYTADGIYPIILYDIDKEFPKEMIDTLGKPKIAVTETDFSKLINGIYD